MKKLLKKMSVLALALVMVCCCVATANAAVLHGYTEEVFHNVKTWASGDLNRYGVEAVIVFNDGLNDEENRKVANSLSTRIDYVYVTNEAGDLLLHTDFKLDYTAERAYLNTTVEPLWDNQDDPLVDEYYYGMYTALVKADADVRIDNAYLYYDMETISLYDESIFE